MNDIFEYEDNEKIISHVYKVTFGVLSPQKIKKNAICEIYKHITSHKNLEGTLIAIAFATQHDKTDATVIDHDVSTNNTRIIAKKAATLMFDWSGYYQTNTLGNDMQFEAVLRVNGSTIKEGSRMDGFNYSETDKETFTHGHIHYPIVLAIDDYVEVMHREIAGAGRLKLEGKLVVTEL